MIGILSGYAFLIRDSSGCLQAKGEVADLNIKLQSVSGMEMFKITETGTNDLNVRKTKANFISIR